MAPRVTPFSEEESAKAYDRAVEIDLIKTNQIKRKLKQLAGELTSTPSLWGGVVSLSFTQMFQASDFPVFSEKVLDGGFSPPDWFLSVGNASAQLGLSVAERTWKDCRDKEKKVEELLGINDKKPNPLSQDQIRRVEKVLRWKEVLDRLDEIAVKVLAFCWLADRLISKDNISCSEAEVTVQKEVWRLLEELLKKDKSILIMKINEMISKMSKIKERVGPREIQLANWTEIFRLPWG